MVVLSQLYQTVFGRICAIIYIQKLFCVADSQLFLENRFKTLQDSETFERKCSRLLSLMCFKLSYYYFSSLINHRFGGANKKESVHLITLLAVTNLLK